MAKVYRMARDPAGQWRRCRDSEFGTWFIDYADVNGKRIRKATDAQSKTDALKLLRAKLSENAKAEILGVSTTETVKPCSFRTFYEDEYCSYTQSRVRPSTYQRKEQLAKHVLPYFGGLTLRAIHAGTIEKFMQERAKASPKPSAAEINRERALLSSVLNTAFRRGLVDSNPVARVRPLREDNARDRWLTPSEVGRIIEKAERWVRPFIVMAVHTGLRVGELCGLKWSDIDLDRGFLKVGQGSKSHRVRYVPINSVVRGVLQSLPRVVGLPWVFVNPHREEAYRPDSVYHDFIEAAQAAEVADATFHTLRHTFASWLIQRGVPIAEVQQYLGHSSDTMTRRYAHLAPASGRRNALEVLVTPEKDGRFLADELAQKKEAL